MLDYQQRLELLMQCKLKKIRQKELAEQVIGTSSAWVSTYFNNPNINISEEHEKLIIEHVKNK